MLPMFIFTNIINTDYKIDRQTTLLLLRQVQIEDNELVESGKKQETKQLINNNYIGKDDLHQTNVFYVL